MLNGFSVTQAGAERGRTEGGYNSTVGIQHPGAGQALGDKGDSATVVMVDGYSFVCNFIVYISFG